MIESQYALCHLYKRSSVEAEKSILELVLKVKRGSWRTHGSGWRGPNYPEEGGWKNRYTKQKTSEELGDWGCGDVPGLL
jgi:hypothetical protein